MFIKSTTEFLKLAVERAKELGVALDSMEVIDDLLESDVTYTPRIYDEIVSVIWYRHYENEAHTLYTEEQYDNEEIQIVRRVLVTKLDFRRAFTREEFIEKFKADECLWVNKLDEPEYKITQEWLDRVVPAVYDVPEESLMEEHEQHVKLAWPWEEK